MRFLHTGDWHLGRVFHKVDLIDDQRCALEQLVEFAAGARLDAVLVAGDIYDRPVPPPDAVELLDQTLSRLVLDLKLPVILIAGNHDSPGRLNFGSRLLAERRLYVRGTLGPSIEPVVLSDAHGPVHFYPVPYAEPITVRAQLGCEAADHDAAMRALLDRIRASHPRGVRSVAIAHAFVAGAAGCESERPLSVGGAGTVDAGCFEQFHYVALGHLHRPQSVGGDHLRYCGSLLKYSFDECAAGKEAVLVEMDAVGACRCESVPLRPRRDVRRLEGSMASLLSAPADAERDGDYLEVTLRDSGPVLDAIDRLRTRYPHVLHIRAPEATPAGVETNAFAAEQVRRLDDAELFRRFYAHVIGADLAPEQTQAYAEIVEAMRRKERHT